MIIKGLRNKKTQAFWRNDFQSFPSLAKAFAVCSPSGDIGEWELVDVNPGDVANIPVESLPLPEHPLERRVVALEQEVFKK